MFSADDYEVLDDLFQRQFIISLLLHILNFLYISFTLNNEAVTSENLKLTSSRETSENDLLTISFVNWFIGDSYFSLLFLNPPHFCLYHMNVKCI